MTDLNAITQHISEVIGNDFVPERISSIGGGCINSAYRLQSDDVDLFVKVNSPHLADMFEAEAMGLTEMAGQHCVKVPEVICHGSNHQHSYLVLEYIELGSLRGAASAQLGEQLAALHAIAQPFFGWHINNTIGSTPQINTQEHDWVSFWQQHRLGKQLQLAAGKGFGGRLRDQGQRLIEELPKFFVGYQPQPSLLHGDLWGGNAAADAKGNPVIFDPACYYGDRETDIAMTELFGGFGGDFRSAYQSHYPLDAGYQSRKTLYNLYHIINHVNLFGGGYLGQAESMIAQLLAELG
ncbi:ribulosamine/erythrulosamine 3-kinase [Methylophaga lonarensis MPL]|uniref:Ribulosamine/erythrulosamine 3-kinase n=2 Tax=Methylophaga lonarensis TaxID=999151 RepID=M7P010_9GAMM|nr:fructosamine kinase family protein [Methylophaga lonarensis]EMR12786.1 ribulosamine/erythrulosamine 3-kinase [Methylophaga lonarensis MPL]